MILFGHKVLVGFVRIPVHLDTVEVCTEKQNRERKAQKYENGELAMEENYSFSLVN